MPSFRLVLANLPHPTSPEDALGRTLDAIGDAGQLGAGLICFPECYLPGYRLLVERAALDGTFLERAFDEVAVAAGRAGVAVVLGALRFAGEALRITALVVDERGHRLGFQDKVQLDPSEDEAATPGDERRLFRSGALRFGVVICHEGFRYPETVRWAARAGAQLVLHPHFDEGIAGAQRPLRFADPDNTFHEKAMLCRAAENHIWFASVNCAVEGSSTTSAVVRPDGTLLCAQPHWQEGLLVADLDLEAASGVLARRLRPSSNAP